MLKNIVYSLIFLGTPCLLAWLIKKNVKIVISILIGLLSLVAVVAMFPLLEILAHLKEMSSKPHVLTFALALIVFTIVFIVIALLCVTSIIKISKTESKGTHKFVKATYIVSVLDSAFTLITLTLSLFSEAGFGLSVAKVLFTSYYRGFEEEKLYLAIVCSFLILVFGIVGLIILKNEQKVKTYEAEKSLTNHFFLALTSISLLFISFFTTIVSFVHFSVIMSFYGKLCILPTTVVSILSFCIFISMLFVGKKPEKLQNFLKKVFSASVLISAIYTLELLIIGKESFIIIISLIVLALAILGLFLIIKSRIVGEKEKKSKSNPLSKVKSISSDDITKGAEILKNKTAAYSNITVATYQGVLLRAKQILLSPQKEFQAIEKEDTPHEKILKSYVLPLLLIPAVFAFIGYGLVGYSTYGHHFSNVGWGFRMAIVQILVLLGGIYLTSLIINVLADNFGAIKNFNRIFSLVAYSYTPILLAGILHIHHSLWWLVFLVGLYGLYILFVGLKPMLKPVEDKADTFTIISMFIPVVSYIILFLILKGIVLPQGFYFM